MLKQLSQWWNSQLTTPRPGVHDQNRFVTTRLALKDMDASTLTFYDLGARGPEYAHQLQFSGVSYAAATGVPGIYEPVPTFAPLSFDRTIVASGTGVPNAADLTDDQLLSLASVIEPGGGSR